MYHPHLGVNSEVSIILILQMGKLRDQAEKSYSVPSELDMAPSENLQSLSMNVFNQ